MFLLNEKIKLNPTLALKKTVIQKTYRGVILATKVHPSVFNDSVAKYFYFKVPK
jgi:hypothetical protein